MTHLERQVISDVKRKVIEANEKLGREAAVFLEVRYSCEDYDDEIAPIPAVEAITEEQPVIVPAKQATYTKKSNGKLVMASKAVKKHMKMTKGKPALYDIGGKMLEEAIEPEPVMGAIVITPAQEAVTDVVEFKNYHRCVIDASGDIPEDVQEFLNNAQLGN